jgi:hypothetical protein
MSDSDDLETDPDGGPGRPSKVPRVIRTYGLDGTGDRLEAYWTREEDRYSLRELADVLNRRVLEAAMVDAGMQPLDDEVASRYRALTDDDVSRGVQREVERTLERAGVDVESVRDDFVSHQAVHTFLTKHRDASLDAASDTPDLDAAMETVERLRSRTQAVTRTTLERLRAADELPFDEFEVFVDIEVVDEDTETIYSVGELLESPHPVLSDRPPAIDGVASPVEPALRTVHWPGNPDRSTRQAGRISRTRKFKGRFGPRTE